MNKASIGKRIRDPHGFAEMLASVIEKNRLPKLPFLKG